VEEIAVDDTPAEGTPEEPEQTPDSEEVAPEQGEVEPEEETPVEDEYLVWARKQYGDDLDPDKLARAAWEKEKLLGQKSQNEKRLEKEAQEREIQARIDFLNTPGVLTDEEDMWIDEAVASADPSAAADALLQEGRADLYGAFVSRWVQQGDAAAREALQHRDRVMEWVGQPQPTESESYASALGQTFLALGMNIDTDGPMVLQKLDELGGSHWAVEAIQSPDPVRRADATRAVVELIRAGQTSVRKARTDDVVQQRVQEEQLRQGAAGITNGGPRVEQPKRSPFWEEFETEEERINSRPQYGKE
jgi:hypothetical protein